MAINVASPMYVNFSQAFDTQGITYDITGTTPQAVPTADGSTVFNVEIPTDYTYTADTLVFKDAAATPQTIATVVTSDATATTLSFYIAQATTWTTGTCTIQFGLTPVV